MFCDRCGAPVGDNSVFCSRCGNALQSKLQPQNPQKTPKKKKIIFGCCLGIFVLCLIIAAVICILMRQQKPENTIYGTWTDDDENISFTFREDGTLRIAGLENTLGLDLVTFTVADENTLELKPKSDYFFVDMFSVNVAYEIEGDTMTLEIAGYRYQLEKQ